jgi:hypothetical protein
MAISTMETSLDHPLELGRNSLPSEVPVLFTGSHITLW